MRAIEAAAIASGEVTGLELMERAGRGVVAAVFAEWPELAAGSHSAAVLCGPGGNGGDGFVVARVLREAGWELEVFLYGAPERMPPDARANYERWVAMGEVWPIAELGDRVDAAPGLTYDLIVDAVFGIGLPRALPDAVAAVFRFYFRGYLDGRLVAVDVPSGLCADSGRPLVPAGPERSRWPALDGLICEPSLTVTFHRKKLGHLLDVGPRHCNRIAVHDIGLSQPNDRSVVQSWDALAPGVVRSLAKGRAAHKFSHGHALMLAGGAGHGGAARLAARGALRIGAGVVTVGCPEAALTENAARLDAVMLRAVADADALAVLLADRRINALCLGPGLGTGDREARLMAVALGGPPPPSPPHEGEGGRPGPAAATGVLARPLRQGEVEGRPRQVVLDGDALTLLARDPALFAMLHEGCVLTPHAGEFARLFPDLGAKLAAPATKGPAYSKVDATREAAARAGCVVLYKGPDTVIADPSGLCAINSAHYDRAAPWLATAGSGDVLAGFVAGLLARGFAPMQAAETAAWLHVECARSFGPGLIAEDLPEELPKVFRALGL